MTGRTAPGYNPGMQDEPKRESGAAAAPAVLLAADDLMFPSRIREALRPTVYRLRVAASAAAVREQAGAEPPAAILVNMSARRFDPGSLIRDLKSDPVTSGVPVLAFAGHVETAKHDAARVAGADMVAANSSVSLHLPKLLARLLSGERSDDVVEEAAESEE